MGFVFGVLLFSRVGRWRGAAGLIRLCDVDDEPRRRRWLAVQIMINGIHWRYKARQTVLSKSFYSSSIYTASTQAFNYETPYQVAKGIVRYHIICKKPTRPSTSHSPPVALFLHSSSNLLEACNVGTSNQRRELTLRGCDVLLGGLEAVIEALLHDALKLLVDLLRCP
jgi:hypothetical protein